MEEPISVVNDEKTKCKLTNSGKVNASPNLFLAMTNSQNVIWGYHRNDFFNC